MLNIKNYQDFSKFTENKLDPKGVVFGIGVTSFMRFFPSLFIKNYKLICFKDSKDNQVLENMVEDIFILKKTRPTIKLPYTNANNLLRNKSVHSYISEHKGKKFLFVYKMNKNMEHAIKGLGLKIIGNSSRLNKMFEDKVSFRKVLVKAGLEPIPGETLKFSDWLKFEYEDFAAKYGSKFVIQLPDFMLGGGKGTTFVDCKRKYNEFKSKVEEGTYKKKVLTAVNITKFISGESPSVACCATKYGTLVTRPQQQILDIPQVISKKKGQGLFVGHVFGVKYPPSIIKQVNEIATKLGNYMYSKGYKGIFGIDLIINKKENKVYPVECNARYTGAFPMVSMLQMKYKIIPLDFLHFLEFLKIPYKIDVKALNLMYQKQIYGSHIILSNIRSYGIEVKKELEVGTYRFAKNKINYLSDSIFYNGLKTPHDFVLVDGVPKQGQIIKKYSRMARIVHVLFNADILKANGKELKAEYLNIVFAIYKAMFNKKQP
ncbi:ATP-grasp domain-containing protein [Patescibacteria group bacterium]